MTARDWLTSHGIETYGSDDARCKSLTALLADAYLKGQQDMRERAAGAAGDVEGNCDEGCRDRIRAVPLVPWQGET